MNPWIPVKVHARIFLRIRSWIYSAFFPRVPSATFPGNHFKIYSGVLFLGFLLGFILGFVQRFLKDSITDSSRIILMVPPRFPSGILSENPVRRSFQDSFIDSFRNFSIHVFSFPWKIPPQNNSRTLPGIRLEIFTGIHSELHLDTFRIFSCNSFIDYFLVSFVDLFRVFIRILTKILLLVQRNLRAPLRDSFQDLLWGSSRDFLKDSTRSSFCDSFRNTL